MNEPDANGLRVKSIYARFDSRYAVYRTEERVTIQFADDPVREIEQREKVARLSPLRGEINGLVDGWRTHKRKRFQSAALRYDRRVADTLIVALEGDVESALLILSQIRDDVVAERKSFARFMYLVYAAATAAMLGLLAAFATSDLVKNQAWFVPYGFYTSNTWLAVAAGTLGAFFSIALGISSRSIHTDLQMLDNIIDAIVRIVIGAIAAIVLQALMDADLFALRLGSAVMGATDHLSDGPDSSNLRITDHLVLLVAAFIAGFSERLIPDLLNSATMAASDKPQTASPIPRPVEKETTKSEGKELPQTFYDLDAHGLNPHSNEEEKIDGCDVDASNSDVPPTPDDRLPAASGGVASSR
ncbi:hypothetical protein [Polaromonas glacialis]|uniref:hypothetical protein n=1 Tax=Polaromonas glacialis TaxID=866564 RepID=UPI0004962703|nr:hypothetical protein [Polaromonas glacialis]